MFAARCGLSTAISRIKLTPVSLPIPWRQTKRQRSPIRCTRALLAYPLISYEEATAGQAAVKSERRP